MYETANVEVNKQAFYKFIRENVKDNKFVMYNSLDDDDMFRVVKA